MKNEKAIEYLNSMKWYWQKEVGQSIFADVYPLVEALNLAIEALSSSEPKTADSGSVDSEMPEVKTDRTIDGLIWRHDAKDRLTILVNEIEGIFADIRERNVDDSVCGLCEYDCDHGIDGSAFECLGFERDDCFKLKDEYREEWTDVKDLPSAQPERKKGAWILAEDGWYCSVCELYPPFDCDPEEKGIPYCPNCGADMRGDKNETD